MSHLYVFHTVLQVDYEPIPEVVDMPWPSRRDKILRAVELRLLQITTANGYQIEVDRVNTVRRDVDWNMANAPCVTMWAGDETPGDESLRRNRKTFNVQIEMMVKHDTEPGRQSERLLEDIKDALYSSNRLTDPDDAGAVIVGRLPAVTVETDEGVLQDRGFAAMMITAGYEIPETTVRTSL